MSWNKGVKITRREYLFRREPARSNPYRVLVLLVIILAALFLLRDYGEGNVKPAFSPTSTPTRVANSFASEGETHFAVGDLNSAITSYQKALKMDPQNGKIWSELARIQVYSSTLLTTDEQRKKRLEDALVSTNQGVKFAPEESEAHAIRAFVLDWNASNTLVTPEQRQTYMTQAEQASVRALQLDSQNTLALVYYAELLNDQMKWNQAEQYLRQALDRDTSLMDVHRVHAGLLESTGYYEDSIQAYKRAAEIAPNLTFLYISIANTYRHLRKYDEALSYYEKAVLINDQLGVKSPIPYLGISKVYTQTGDFFIASRNVKKALSYDPSSPDVYGQLGIIYVKSRNYEGAIPSFECAIRGCDAAQSCEVRECNPKKDPEIKIIGMPLTGNTLVYYYSYGSVLAAMHRPNSDFCDKALKVLAEVRAGYSSDPTTMSIVGASEQICASFGVTR